MRNFFPKILWLNPRLFAETYREEFFPNTLAESSTFLQAVNYWRTAYIHILLQINAMYVPAHGSEESRMLCMIIYRTY
jgi:hypothetical protein